MKGWLAREIRTKYAELKEALATIGPWRTCVVIVVRLTDALFDKWYGLDTVARVPLESLTIPDSARPGANAYQPTGILAFRRVLREARLPRHLGFVDYGCGKGRVVLLAAAAGFSSAVGIAFAAELAAIARANASEYRRRKPGIAPIQILQMDASAFDPPPELGIFYFYSPFDASVMRRAVDRIVASLERSPREAWLVYHLPRHREAVEATGRFAVHREFIAGGYECVIYRHRPGVRAPA
jgi:predicted RNA methylase